MLSTPPGVAVRVIGGLGSDQINVAGDVNGNVYSRDIEGTSAVINHGIVSNDPAYNNLVVNGVSLSVAQASQGAVIITETGNTDVTETSTHAIGSLHSYTVQLATKPTGNVYITISAGTNPQEEMDNLDGTGVGDSLLLSTLTTWCQLAARIAGIPLAHTRHARHVVRQRPDRSRAGRIFALAAASPPRPR